MVIEYKQTIYFPFNETQKFPPQKHFNIFFLYPAHLQIKFFSYL